MTTERAMRLAEKWADGLVCSLREGEAAEYHKMFLDMLCAQQEAEKTQLAQDTPTQNEPLTLDELREMDSEPVYIGMKLNDPAGRYGLHELGWLAYRRKPEEGAEIGVAKDKDVPTK